MVTIIYIYTHTLPYRSKFVCAPVFGNKGGYIVVTAAFYGIRGQMTTTITQINGEKRKITVKLNEIKNRRQRQTDTIYAKSSYVHQINE